MADVFDVTAIVFTLKVTEIFPKIEEADARDQEEGVAELVVCASPGAMAFHRTPTCPPNHKAPSSGGIQHEWK